MVVCLVNIDLCMLHSLRCHQQYITVIVLEINSADAYSCTERMDGAVYDVNGIMVKLHTYCSCQSYIYIHVYVN